MTRTQIWIAVAAGLMPVANTSSAQTSQPVRFERGNDNASVSGAIQGGQYRDYVLGARAGQRMGVSLITKGSAYFNILPPGSTGEAIYNSSIDGNDATNVTLPKTGPYRIRVYLMGAAKGRARPVAYTLSMSVMN